MEREEDMGKLDFFSSLTSDQTTVEDVGKQVQSKGGISDWGEKLLIQWDGRPTGWWGAEGEKNEPAERRKLGRSELCGKQREKNKLQGYR